MFTTLTTDFATKLGITNSSQIEVLGWFLESIDTELKADGLVWTTNNTTSSKVFYSDSKECRSIYFIQPLQKTNSILTIKNLKDSNYTENLLLNTDYILYEHYLPTNPIFGIELIKKPIKTPFYLEITGVWKFGDTLPSDIKFAVLNLASEYMALYNQNLNNQNGRITKSTSIDEVSFSYGSIDINSLANRKTFDNIISKYKTFNL
jgi:hypothetical protein